MATAPTSMQIVINRLLGSLINLAHKGPAGWLNGEPPATRRSALFLADRPSGHKGSLSSGLAAREPDAQGEGVQHQGERCRGNCAGDDRTPLQIEDSLYQRCRMSIRRRAWLHKPWALRMSWHDLSCRR
jgi:hypothetical protein